jgi:uncharacterized protein
MLPNTSHILLTATESESQIANDCACATSTVTPGFDCQGTYPLSRTSDTHSVALDQQYWLLYSPLAPAGPTVVNQKTYQYWASYGATTNVDTSLDSKLMAQGLLHPLTHTPIPQPNDTQPKTLTTWLHITNACNLDCPYCFVRKSTERLTHNIGYQAVDSLVSTAQQHAFQKINLKYAGGEATLHFNLIRDLHQYALEQVKHTDIKVEAVILTNGVHFTSEMVAWSLDNNIRIMISLDGIGAVHDTLRPMHNGKSSFDRVMTTIDQRLLPTGLCPTISMTLTSSNIQDAPQMVEWMMIQRGLPLNFNFVRDTPNAKNQESFRAEQITLIEGLTAAYKVVEEHLEIVPLSHLNSLLDRLQMVAHTHTCGVGRDYVVINHKGQVHSCQMHVNNSNAPLLQPDLIPLIAHGKIPAIAVDSKVGCTSCQWRYRCSGGCPLETFRATGRWDIQSPYCMTYRSLYPILVRMVGLKLLLQVGIDVRSR